MSETPSDQIQRHADHLGEMSRPGGSLRADGAHATVANPDWFDDGSVAYPTLERDRFHRQVLADFRAEKSTVLDDRKAIVLAGPPGAGKSTVLANVVKEAGSNMGQWRVIDADHFKDVLLRQALDDGSYESWLVPGDVKELQATGERFYPRELAALVHDESSYLARLARGEAIAAGERVVIDTVLSSPSSAVAIGRTLEAAGYEVTVVEVEVPLELSRERTRARWQNVYVDAERGANGAELGGRWVPSEYPESLFRDGRSTSTCLDAAQQLANSSRVVKRFERHSVDPETGALRRDQVLARRAPGSPLVDDRTAAAYRFAMEGVVRPGRPASPPPKRGGRGQ